MDDVTPPLAGRLGGTTDADRRTAAAFVFARPGWGMQERRMEGGDTCLGLRTPGTGWVWRVMRTRTGLALVDATAGVVSGEFAAMRDLLVTLWEADGRVPPG